MKVSLLSNLDLLSQPDQLARQFASSSSLLQATELQTSTALNWMRSTLFYPWHCLGWGRLSRGDSFGYLFHNSLDSLQHLPALSYYFFFFYPGSACQGYFCNGVYSTPPGVGKLTQTVT